MNKSIWGEGDKLTLKVLNELDIKGNWLDLAAGDGRYIDILLNKADKVIASDINRAELYKIKDKISNMYKHKLEFKIFDLKEKFPFENNQFDGIFCTGTLHLFNQKILESIFQEINRILKPNGLLVIDFATDEKRTKSNGKEVILRNQPQYTIYQAKRLLKNLLNGYELKIHESEFEDDLTDEPEYGFKTIGKFILLIGKKYSQ